MIYLIDVWRVRGSTNWRWRMTKRRGYYAPRQSVAAALIAFPSRAAACANASETTGLPVHSPRFVKGNLSLGFTRLGIRSFFGKTERIG